MRLADAIAVVSFVAVLPACAPEYPLCSKDKHCFGDERCIDALCQNCRSDRDCIEQTPPGYAPWVCKGFRCTETTKADTHEPDPPAVGPCTKASDCEGGEGCKEGRCQPCTEDRDCDGACTEQTGRCSPAGQCAPGRLCPDGETCDGGMCIWGGHGGGGPCGTEAVFFAFDSDELTPASQTALQAVGKCLVDRGGRVLVEGHTDAAGDQEFNIGLAEGRARTVKAALMRAGVPEAMISTIAKGNLEAQGNDAKSRRAQLFFE